MKSFLIGLFVFTGAFLFPVRKDKKNHHFAKSHEKLSVSGKLNLSLIPECSGICYTKNKTLLTHNDGGNPATLFEINLDGEILREVAIRNTKNIDWEDLTQDTFGNTYVGDFGNNINNRKNLVIYKLNEHFEKTAEIHFHYPDQQKFPPEKEKMNFDCEAMFWYKDFLYLFSKNRGDKGVKIYRIPSTEGNHIAEIVDSIVLSGWITGADISHSQKEFSLLSYGQIYKFEIKENELNFSNPKSIKYYQKLAQAEGICYLNDSTMVITNEQGRIFLLN